jgi:hypothetical protein
MRHVGESALDARTRRAAKRCKLIATKSRWRRGSVDNFGGFMLVDTRNNIVAGSRFELT